MVAGANLRNNNTKSCGCYKRERSKARASKEDGQASFNRVYRYYQTNAKRKALEFNLSKEQFRMLAEQPCEFCGRLPRSFFKRADDNGRWIYNGIDRLDNFQGYTEDNSVPCCQICNRAKSNMNVADWMSYLVDLVAYRKGK